MQLTTSRSEIQQLASDEISRILGETGVLIRPGDFPRWRPTVRTRGTIPGIPCELICVATEGNLGIFLTTSSDTFVLGKAFIGHVRHFSYLEEGKDEEGNVCLREKFGAPLPLFTSSSGKTYSGPRKPKAEKKKSARQQILDSI